MAIYGKDEDKWGPASVYALCDVQDGNYVLVDVARQESGRYPLFDGDHEAWPDPAYCKQVASSFSGVLGAGAAYPARIYWLGEMSGSGASHCEC